VDDDNTSEKQKKKAQGTKQYQTPLNISKTSTASDGSGVNTPK
jgi:hypothetical protein